MSTLKTFFRSQLLVIVSTLCCLVQPLQLHAQTSGPEGAGEVNLVLPDIRQATFLGGIHGRDLLFGELFIAVLGLLFGIVILTQLKRLPVHKSMLEISELIYETCKTYLATQGKFLVVLEALIAATIIFYFGVLQHLDAIRVGIILLFSLAGICGSFGVAWFGIRVNTFANSRTAFASLSGRPFPVHVIPLKAGMSIGMLLISVELLLMLFILLVVPRDYAGSCFLGFAIGESLCAAALRVAGGIFTKIADIGADLMKIVFRIEEDDPRNPGTIADCTGDNAGDSVGPSADGFETYGVTIVALISFIALGVHSPIVQGKLLIWMFAIGASTVVSSALSYLINSEISRRRYATAETMDFEAPLTFLVWLTSAISIAVTYLVSYLIIGDLNGDSSLWWKLSTVLSCGTLAGAVIPELVKIFTSPHFAHVREVLTSSREGGAALNILSGLVAGKMSAFWLGLTILSLMAAAYRISMHGFGDLMMAPSVFAFGLVAFGFLSMGPVTIAVDSMGPVADNAQSVFELSTIEKLPNIEEEIRKDFGINVHFENAKYHLEENDGAGNTFKASAKPVLIGTAVVGSTTMIFSIVIALTHGLQPDLLEDLSILYPPFLLGLIAGGSVIYWFTGASIQSVTTGAYRAVQFIKSHIHLQDNTKASVADSKRVVEICTRYAQRGVINIFVTVFAISLALAFLDPYLFIGYLVSIALFGLYQAIFLANAGGAWDNAKKIVETELREKGTDLHAATVVGDIVGDPFKDTSSVAMNPIIKFTTLFGLLAVELAVSLSHRHGASLAHALSAAFMLVALYFIWRSFYRMRILG